MSVHNKEPNNWMVNEIKAEYACDECELKFPRMSQLTSHIDTVHVGNRGIIEVNDKGKKSDFVPEENNHSIDEIPLNVNSFPCDCNICGELLMDN